MFLYLVVDVWSRRIVGWRVHVRESAELAAEMIHAICDESGIDPKGLVLHSDNGKPRQRKAYERKHQARDVAVARHRAVL